MTSPAENVTTTDTNYGGNHTTKQAKDIFGMQYNGSISDYFNRQTDNEIFQKGDPCSSQGKLGEINNNIQKIFVVLRGIQKYGKFYISTATNAIANLKSTISAITGAIAGVLKSLVQRLRNWVLNKIKSLITYALELIMTNFLKTIKESIVSAIIDQIFCSFEKIIKGLFGLVGDFLYSLIGQIVQAPLCAVEQWTNALINRLVDDIDKALAPIFENINDILGGVGKIFGSVSSAIDTILGFQGFLCGGPECPEIKEFALSPWGGPTKTQKDNFSNFNFGISPTFAGEITKSADAALNDFFGEGSNTSQSPGECYTGNFECGLPQVAIFGGGGSGAIAEAVVNNVGQVIGTNLLNKGSGYKSPPFVQIVDPAGCGSNASGFVEMETDDDGYETGGISDIVIDNPGSGYEIGFNGGAPVIQTFFGSPNPLIVNGSITLNWDVVNADKVFIKNMSTYNDLPLIGTLTFPISESDVSFGPEENLTTKRITLVAENNNTNSSNQQTEKEIIITILKEGQSDEPFNSLPPEINSFRASKYTAVPGELITLSWDTQRSETTTIQDSLSDENSNTENVPSVGSLTVVIPQDVVLPTNGSGLQVTYTLTVQNDNAIENQNDGSIIQTDSRTLSIIVSNQLDPVIPPPSDGGDSTTPDDDSTTPGDDESPGADGDSTTPGADGDTTSGDGTTSDDSGNTGGNNNAVAVINTVDIIDTGIGYDSNDTISIDDGDGGEFGIDVNQLGQIVGLNVIETGYGYTTIPNISINSKSGAGAAFRTRLKFIPLDEFEDLENGKLSVDPNKLVQVIDCVGKTRPVVGYINGEPYYGPFHYHPSRGVKMTGAVHVSTPHEVIYDTVLESLENMQRVVSNASARTTTNTTSTQNTMDTSSSSYGTSTPSSNTTSTVTTTTTTTTTTPSSSSSGSSGSSSSGSSGSSSSSSSGSSGSSGGGSYGY